MSGFNFLVGDRVRVEVAGGARRAYLSTVDDDGDASVSVSAVYLDEWKGMPMEEESVSSGRVSALQPFEQPSSSSGSGRDTTARADEEQLKAWGNVLYKLKDFVAASALYRRALPCRGSDPSVGSEVMVYSDDLGDAHCGAVGMVSLAEAEAEDGNGDVGGGGGGGGGGSEGRRMHKIFTVDVECTGGEEVELERRAEDLVVLPSETERRTLLRALHTNLARCSLQVGRTGWAARHAGVAYTLATHVVEFDDAPTVAGTATDADAGAGAGVDAGASSSSVPGWISGVLGFGSSLAPPTAEAAAAAAAAAPAESSQRRKARMDTLTLRVKALLKAGRSAPAEVAAGLLVEVAGPGPAVGGGGGGGDGGAEKAQKVLEEIARFKKNRQRSNKQLAKNVAAWVAESLEVAEKHGVSITL